MKNEKLSWKVSLGLNLSGSSCLPSLKLEQQFGNNWGTPTTSLMTVQNPWLLQLLDFLVSLCNVLCVVTYKNISCGGGLRSNVRGEYLSKWTGPFPWTLLSINHPFAIWWQQVLVQQLALKVNIWYSHFMVTQQKPCLESRKLLVSSIHQGIHSNSLLSSAEISKKQTESQTFYPCTCQEQTCSAEHSQCGARQCCGLGGFSKAVCLVYSKTSEHIQSCAVPESEDRAAMVKIWPAGWIQPTKPFNLACGPSHWDPKAGFQSAAAQGCSKRLLTPHRKCMPWWGGERFCAPRPTSG